MDLAGRCLHSNHSTRGQFSAPKSHAPAKCGNFPESAKKKGSPFPTVMDPLRAEAYVGMKPRTPAIDAGYRCPGEPAVAHSSPQHTLPEEKSKANRTRQIAPVPQATLPKTSDGRHDPSERGARSDHDPLQRPALGRFQRWGRCVSRNKSGGNGLRSAARNNKATRQRTRPYRATKSSAKDLSLRKVKLQSAS